MRVNVGDQVTVGAMVPGVLLRHAVSVACAAESLARVSHRSLASEAFIAGLLHDFGVMLQLQVDRALLLEVIAALGAAVGNHHAPAAAPPDSRRLAALVHLADTISLETGHGYAVEPQAWPLQAGTLELLGIQETFLSHVAETLPERTRELQRVLSES